MSDAEIKLVVRDDGYGDYRLIVMLDGHEEHTSVEAKSAKHVASEVATLLTYLSRLEEIR